MKRSYLAQKRLLKCMREDNPCFLSSMENPRPSVETQKLKSTRQKFPPRIPFEAPNKEGKSAQRGPGYLNASPKNSIEVIKFSPKKRSIIQIV